MTRSLINNKIEFKRVFIVEVGFIEDNSGFNRLDILNNKARIIIYSYYL